MTRPTAQEIQDIRDAAKAEKAYNEAAKTPASPASAAGAGRGKVQDYAKIRDNPKAERAAAIADMRKSRDDIDDAMIMDRASLPSANEQEATRLMFNQRIKNAEKAAGGREPGEDLMRTDTGYAKGGKVKGWGEARGARAAKIV